MLPNADGIGILVAMAEFAICVLLIAGLFAQVVGAIETIRATGPAPRWTQAADPGGQGGRACAAVAGD